MTELGGLLVGFLYGYLLILAVRYFWSRAITKHSKEDLHKNIKQDGLFYKTKKENNNDDRYSLKIRDGQ